MPSPLAFPTEQSLGRRYDEPSDPIRNPFQRDRDRIVHSRAFRRLADKTQVATLPNSNHCHTRLTHTIEVSQVARTIARALDLTEDLVEALALAHDLGHPPLGHIGEKALDEELKQFGASFSHHVHGLRIVEQFERRYARHRGLNLVHEVREGIIKHSRDLDPEDDRFIEYGPHLQPTLEAQVIDGADAIAYLTSDLEDAIGGGHLTLVEASERVPAFRTLLDSVRSTTPGVNDRLLLSETQSRLVGQLVIGFVNGIVDRIRASGVKDWIDVREFTCRLAYPDEAAESTMAELRTMLTETYYSDVTQRLHSLGYVARLKELFWYFIDRPEALPVSTRDLVNDQPLHQVVGDYIAGMTDSFLLRAHKDLVEGTVLKSEHATLA